MLATRMCVRLFPKSESVTTLHVAFHASRKGNDLGGRSIRNAIIRWGSYARMRFSIVSSSPNAPAALYRERIRPPIRKSTSAKATPTNLYPSLDVQTFHTAATGAFRVASLTKDGASSDCCAGCAAVTPKDQGAAKSIVNRIALFIASS